ncbi:MAG: hypothetical protein ACK4GC_08790 [Paracoccaceae bacterium]
MIDGLRTAGFLAVDAEGDTIRARLSASSVDFTAKRADDDWRLALHSSSQQ